MSRSQIHRKINSTTGLSTSAFVHKQSIKATTILLRSTHANINTISTGLGFKSASYYNNHFEEIIGYPPAEYIHKQSTIYP